MCSIDATSSLTPDTAQWSCIASSDPLWVSPRTPPTLQPTAPQATLIEVKIGLIHRQDETPVPTTRKGRPRASGNRPTGLRSGGYLTNRRIHAYHRCCAGEGRGGGGSGCPKPQPSPPGRVGSSDPCTWLPYRHRRRPPPAATQRRPSRSLRRPAWIRTASSACSACPGTLVSAGEHLAEQAPPATGQTPGETTSPASGPGHPLAGTRGSGHRQTLKSDLFCRPQEVAHA